ncbi:Uncharacterized protein FWK35_00005455 [Aphis craccivora]|uniref:Uncharacterized protein n=1 Tax=Aphis craccivora TaxID=307492 RepID=A0A6G0Z5L3_APHCR|nr:Uncharacterized protein FWK35_00005455 [Aphis craccivora]
MNQYNLVSRCVNFIFNIETHHIIITTLQILKKAGKWVPLCCTLGAVWITIYCRTVKFESNDNYHCIRKTILNEDDLSA